MKTGIIAIVLACCSTMTAQISDYLGPGILTRGAGDIGTRAGQDVNLRFFANVNGIYDTGLQPYSVDGAGHLVTVDGLYGIETSLGVYGIHNFRHARLGLDYRGTYRHYTGNSFFDGTDHTLALGYTYQKSRRLVFDMRQTAGTVSQGTPFGNVLPVTDSVVTPSSLLFDNRMNYLQSTLDVNFRLSEHTTLTLGGDGFGVWRKATGLIGMEGYTLRGAIQRRVTKRTTLGVSYQHTHYDYPKAFGESDVNSFSGTFATQLGQFWTVNVQGGAYVVEAQGLQQVAVAPEIAALLGVQTALQTFYQKSIFPQWNGTLTRRFQRATLSFQYQSGANGGNGVYLTSRQDNGNVNFSYTANRKWSFSASGGYSRLTGIGQNLQPYSQFTGGSGVTYALTHAIQVLAKYDARHQEITNGVYLQDSYRATIGISFSPADIPLAFH
ncbi:MAG: hypothetical protein LAP61_04120 [Acidobacteriia bacterium]|nr:hypothetical protein [Terriglobia bacterium]